MTTTIDPPVDRPRLRSISRPDPPAPICYSLSKDAQDIVRILDREFQAAIKDAERDRNDHKLLSLAVLKTQIKRAIIAEVCR